MCLYFALMYKTLGGYNWSDIFKSTLPGVDNECSAASEAIVEGSGSGSGFDSVEDFSDVEKGIMTSAKELQTSFHGLKAVCNQNVSALKLFIKKHHL